MTAGHRHRTVHTKHGSWLHRVLTITLTTSTDLRRVERSRWAWGPVADVDHEPPGPSNGRPTPRPPQPTSWRLTPLGILHGVVGLTLDVPDQ